MIIIRQINSKDFDKWRGVYQYYAEHYEVSLTEVGIETTWNWLIDDSNPLNGIVAENTKNIVGLAHYRAMPSPLRGKLVGFIDDIIVTPKNRGKGVGKMLLNEIKGIGIRENWGIIRWITRDNNYIARLLYDKVANKSDWNVYEMNL